MSVKFEYEITKPDVQKGDAKKSRAEPDCSGSVSDGRVIQQYQDQLQALIAVSALKRTNLNLTYSELTISAWWFAAWVSVGVLAELGGV